MYLYVICNWCVQNYHKITLRNTSSSSVTVYGYVGANETGNAQVINRGGTVKSARLSAGTTGKFTKIGPCLSPL